MSCQFSSVVSCFASVRHGLVGFEFHFLVRILLRIPREESSPLIVIFNRYEISFVLPFRDHRWRFLSYSPSGIFCRQCPLVVRLGVTFGTVHVVTPNSFRIGYPFNPHPSSSFGMSFPMCISKRRPIRVFLRFPLFLFICTYILNFLLFEQIGNNLDCLVIVPPTFNSEVKMLSTSLCNHVWMCVCHGFYDDWVEKRHPPGGQTVTQ
jgi:hypothetical protein